MRDVMIGLLGLALVGACGAKPPASAANAAQEAPPGAGPAAAPLATGTGAAAGLNATYLDPELKVDDWVARFSAESREVAAKRDAVVAAIGLRAGDAVADIGAGSGLYVEPFAQAVGADGAVYAVDISPGFIEHLTTLSADRGWSQVRVVTGDERSVNLPIASVDVAFVCDTYHHFEYPEATLKSLFDAIRPGGRLYVIDFVREAGVSKPWTLEHVRAGKEVFAAEITAAGFIADGELDVGFLDNYFLRFQRPAR